MRRIRIVFVLTLAAICGCSAQTPIASNTASRPDTDIPPPRAEDPLAHLKREFDRPSSPEARTRAAALLVRHRDPDPRYWSYLAAAASKAITAELHAAKRWREAQIVEQAAQGTTTVVAAREGTNASATWGTTQAKSGTARRIESPRMRGHTQVLNLTERSLDPSNVAPLLYISIAGDERGAQLLYEALNSDNVLMSAQGAMGLAKLRETASVERIIAAASRFPDSKLLFAQALVYFNDPKVDAVAATMLRNPRLFEELRTSAKAANFDPYPIDEPHAASGQ